MSTNQPTFRFPFALAGQPKEVQQAHVFAFQGILDCQQGIAALKEQLSAKASASGNSTVTNVTATSETVIQEISPGVGLGIVNNQSGNTSYTTQQSDNEGLIVLNDASPIAVTLNSVVISPYAVFITNFGAGGATITPSSGNINSGASFALLQNYTALVAFDGFNWWASAMPIVPVNTPAVTHEWLASYNATTGAFTQTQPAFSDISGAPSTTQVPVQSLTTTGVGAATLSGGVLNVPTPVSPSGFSGTVALAKLTTLGANGSLTVVNGIITAVTQPS